MRPLIGITTSLFEGDASRPNRAVLNGAYIRAVEHAGGIPVLLSPHHTLESTRELLDVLVGVVLSGGGDVDPARYGQSPDLTVVGVSETRDSYELSVIEMAMAREMPLLLICRGLQVFNVAMGGTLIQDIPITGPLHSQPQPRGEATHLVRIDPAARLAKVLGSERLMTNSMHHQAIDRPGDGIVPVGWAEDGVIEGAEMPGYRGWLLGVQWHPEELTPGDGPSEALFAAFLGAGAAFGSRSQS